MGVGTLVLAVAAVFATKANKARFNTANTAFTTGGIQVIATGHFTTVSTHGTAAYFRTAVNHTLFTSTSGLVQVYYK